MKMVLASYGGRGDVEPAVVVGRELLRRGHDVRMAVPPTLVGFAEAAGLLDELATLDWASAADGETLRLGTLRALSPARQANLLRYRLRQLGWQAPATVRLAEFCRQLQTAGPDRHPELVLPEGRMHAGRGRLHWESAK